MPSQAFQRFYDSLAGGPDWRDFLDVSAFDECTELEKERIRVDIRKQLTTSEDRRLALAIPSLFAPDEATLQLLATVARRARMISSAAGQTLLALSSGIVRYQLEEMVKVLPDDLEARLDALNVIDQIPGWATTFYLVRFLDDADARVRADVAGKLFVRLGIANLPSDPLLGPRRLLRQVQSDSALIAKVGVDELKQIVNHRPKPTDYPFGAPQPYSPAFVAFIESLDPAKPAIDVSAFSSLTGEERASAEALLADHLYSNDAARPPRAVAALQQLAPEPIAAALLAEHATTTASASP